MSAFKYSLCALLFEWVVCGCVKELSYLHVSLPYIVLLLKLNTNSLLITNTSCSQVCGDHFEKISFRKGYKIVTWDLCVTIFPGIRETLNGKRGTWLLPLLFCKATFLRCTLCLISVGSRSDIPWVLKDGTELRVRVDKAGSSSWSPTRSSRWHFSCIVHFSSCLVMVLLVDHVGVLMYNTIITTSKFVSCDRPVLVCSHKALNHFLLSSALTCKQKSGILFSIASIQLETRWPDSLSYSFFPDRRLLIWFPKLLQIKYAFY